MFTLEIYSLLVFVLLVAVSVLSAGKSEKEESVRRRHSPVQESRRAHLERLSAQVRAGEQERLSIYHKAVFFKPEEELSSSSSVTSKTSTNPSTTTTLTPTSTNLTEASLSYVEPMHDVVPPADIPPQKPAETQNATRSTYREPLIASRNNIAMRIAERLKTMTSIPDVMTIGQTHQNPTSANPSHAHVKEVRPKPKIQYGHYQFGLDVSPIHGIRNLGRSPTSHPQTHLHVPIPDDYPENPELYYQASLAVAHESKVKHLIHAYKESSLAYDEIQKKIASA